MYSQDYKRMDVAPMDGTIVLVLAQSRVPRAAYYDATGKWMFVHSDDPCYPDYWTAIPAQPYSDYLPPQKAAEDKLAVDAEIAWKEHQLDAKKPFRRPRFPRGPGEKPTTEGPRLAAMTQQIKTNTEALRAATPKPTKGT